MFLACLQGAVLALSATLMPGPFQAYLLSRALKFGWKRTLPAALAPLVTDGPIIALVVIILTQIPRLFLDILQILGGLFILYIARKVFLNTKNPVPVSDATDSVARQSFFHAIGLNALNPNPYIFWGVVAGPILVSLWGKSMGLGISFVAGFYGTFVCGLAILIVLFAAAGRINPKINRLLSVSTATALLFFGLYQITAGLSALAVAG